MFQIFLNYNQLSLFESMEFHWETVTIDLNFNSFSLIQTYRERRFILSLFSWNYFNSDWKILNEKDSLDWYQSGTSRPIYYHRETNHVDFLHRISDVEQTDKIVQYYINFIHKICHFQFSFWITPKSYWYFRFTVVSFHNELNVAFDKS